MKNDERLNGEIKSIKNITYYIFWLGIFGVLLYRWFVLDQSLTETFDIFIVWLLASLVDFFMMAFKGVPLSFPVNLNKKEQILYILLVPFFASFIPVVIIAVMGSLNGIGHAVITYISTFVPMIILYSIYKIIVYYWEKRNLE